jgi:hypothetical protein
MGKSLVTTVVGLIIGVLVALLLLSPKKGFTTWGLGVNAQTGAPSLEPLEMHPKDEVHWVTATSKNLEIETEQQIFANSVYQSATKRYRVTCSNNICDSGPLLTTLPTMPKDGYKYWQGLADPASPTNIQWFDGHIIIVRP